jgi:hypothetical protein
MQREYLKVGVYLFKGRVEAKKRKEEETKLGNLK